MSEEQAALMRVLEKSVEKNGKDYPLTLGHLLNLLKASERHLERERERDELEGLAFEYRAEYE